MNIFQALKRHPEISIVFLGSFLVIFALLLWLRPRARVNGQLFMAYLGLYGVLRFIIEIFRAGYTAKLMWGPLTQAQVASLVMMVIAVGGWLGLKVRETRAERARRG